MVDGHCFQLLASLDTYIRTLEYRNEQFFARQHATQQALEFFTKYARVIVKRETVIVCNEKRSCNSQVEQGQTK